jgi:serine phosphatase RsbU (regulator of sigma subunit)
VTGILGRIEVDSGVLSWTNAGHPLPLLVRGGRVVRELPCPPTPPWGLAGGDPTVATEALEPGDRLLLYTDGVIEARTPEGEEFGLDRLIDLTNRYGSDLEQPEAITRQLAEQVRAHQSADLVDDATIVMLGWGGPSSR